MESHCKDEDDMVQQRELPFDLVTQHILTRLPIKSIVRFKSVSKIWYSTLSSSRFAFDHFKFPKPSTTQSLLIRSDNKFQIMSYENAEIDLVNIEVDFDVGDENVVLVGSCNGLVCLGSTSGRMFILWNPITREFHNYFESEISSFAIKECMVTWGFGYVSEVDDYRIVRIYDDVFCTFRVDVYSTRFSKWRRIHDEVSHNFSDGRIDSQLRRPGVLFNETLYWAGDEKPPILSFDLASDMLYFFPLPEYFTDDNDMEYLGALLCVVNGYLSMYFRHFVSGEDVITIFKGRGEMEHVIISKDGIGPLYYDNLIGSPGSDKIFTQSYEFYGDAPCLGVVDITSQPSQHLKRTPLMILKRSRRSEIVSYYASLISPNMLMSCYKDA
ncbi:F-box/kelch-repeat protein At3g23880-like [Silene latifolia]|uniref:F-box/kelch-repeat protein At3g23880-like n=1 Tax=Silene latifolia TaxID=37657 RepID=UPI003D78582D